MPTTGSGTQPLRAPLRWAGSKRALLPRLAELAPTAFGTYFEPFFGSGCLYFHLRPEKAVLGDFNSELMSFYSTFRASPMDVLGRFESWPPDQATYNLVRSTEPESLSIIEGAARFLFLNRLAFNGVYRTNRLGRFNVPMGRDTGSLPSSGVMVEIAKQLSTASLIAGDYRETLREVAPDDFVYLDPPYVNSSRRTYGEYGYGSFAKGHIDGLREELASLGNKNAKVLFSFGSIEGLGDVLEGWNVEKVRSRRRVAASNDARRVNDEEILAWNY